MKKIVVAESSPTIKSVADTLLRQNGYDVVCTSDGLQAWEVISSGRPDLVLAGLNLSGINGLELCRQMAGDGLSGGIPVVVMVGSRDNVSEDQLISAGVKAKLKKPFSPRDLLNIVVKLIGEGEKSGQPKVAPKGATGTTNYQADVLSTTRHLEDNKGDVYNLDWKDLNDTGIGKDADIKQDDPASRQASDQEIEINEDQFGLISIESEEPETPATGPQSSDDEDYDWFVGEMKKENMEGSEKKVENDKKPEKKSTPARPDVPQDIIDDDEIKFEDFESTGSKILGPNDKPRESKTTKKQTSRAATATAPKKLTEEELSKIADKVTRNLAAAISASIDRQKILDAIKSVMNQ